MNTNNANRVSELNSEIINAAKSLEAYAKYIGDHVSDADSRKIKSYIRMAGNEILFLIDTFKERERLD